ncbi:MAG: hypothetical protein Q8P75_00740 [bacterium]|nr:hypothetical protein [bacterium]
MNYRFLFWVEFLVSAGLFFAPITVAERTGLGLDKLVHVALFAGLLYLGDRGYRGNKIALIMLLALYALAVEFIQGGLLPYRSFDVWDIVAGWMGLLAMGLLRRPTPRNDKTV